MLVANDLDTLPANFLVSRIRRKPLIYDSHEYFTEVPELIGRPVVRAIWTWLERMFVPKVQAAYTVCESIAEVYRDLYKVDFKVVRNLPVCSQTEKQKPQEKVKERPKIILYQGAMNLGRGIEAVIRAMSFVDDAEFWLAGDGDITLQLQEMVYDLELDKKVKFLGRLPASSIA